MRQCLSAFFSHFVIRVRDALDMLESAYLTTLRIICNAPAISPLQEIDTYQVSKFILNLLNQGCRKSDGSTFYTHNNLAFAMLAEILNTESNIDQETLIKSLTHLYIQIDDDVSRENLQEAVKKVTEMVHYFSLRVYSIFYLNKLYNITGIIVKYNLSIIFTGIFVCIDCKIY